MQSCLVQTGGRRANPLDGVTKWWRAMKKLTLTEAFANYGAKLKNTRWAYSAIADDGAIVFSCWSDHLKSIDEGHMRYDDCLSRWDSNQLGKNLFVKHLKMAIDGNLPVRLVVARQDGRKERVSGDASSLPKTFSVVNNLVGKVVEFDGDVFAIEFRP
jgi:hypothetical protein